ncbi:MAG: TonB-dependent receptor plug domain-containing protein [Myxococcota bacterium]
MNLGGWYRTHARRLALAFVTLFLTPDHAAAQSQTPNAGREKHDEVEVLEVRGAKASEGSMENSARALDVVELEAQRIRPADMGIVLRQTRGITLRQSGGLGTSTELSLNGLSGQQVPLFVDGVPLELTGFPQDASTLPVGLIKRIEVYKGVVPVEFGGDALGGALNFQTYAPTETFAFVGYEIGSFNTQRATGALTVAPSAVPLYMTLTGFLDDTDNNYAVDVEVAQPNGRIEPARVDRFHDGFTSYGASTAVGVAGTSYANRLELRAFANENDKELQHGIRQGDIPFGAVRNDASTLGATLVYEKSGIGQFFDVEIVGSYRRIERHFIDVSDRFFSWTGEVAGQRNPPGELGFGFGLDRTLTDDDAFGRINIEAEVSDSHAFVFNVSSSYRARDSFRLEIRGNGDERRVDSEPAEVLELTSGLSHRSRWLEDAVENDLFVKGYLLRSEADETLGAINFSQPLQIENERLGVGDALVVRLSDTLRAAASYEFATRLPTANEILGDGALIAGNPALTPESSHNFNLSVSS